MASDDAAANDCNSELLLEDSVSQCKLTFENIICVPTTALLKKSTLEKILCMLQEFICKINVPMNEMIHCDEEFTEPICDEVSANRKINHKAFDSFKALCSEKKKKRTAQKPELYKCADCKYQTLRKADLKKHLKRHMGVCNYCCNYCARTFFDKYNLERHINANHTKKQKYSCKTCAYSSYLYDSLKRHEQLKHGDHTESKYICSICYHVSASKHDMSIHLFIHKKCKPYMCEECGSMFAIKSRLQTHKNTVHSERVHMCNVCDKTFQSQSLVKRHMFIHSRVKPYSCPFCNHSSNSQSNLTKHVRNIHSKDGFSYHKFINGKQ